MPRTSTDIGIVFPRRGTLTALLQDDANNIADRLAARGETPRCTAPGGRQRIAETPA